jgi:hypothetical protein
MAYEIEPRVRPFKKFICPTCNFEFSSPNIKVNDTIGKTCPNGHWHNLYQLKKFMEENKARLIKDSPKLKQTKEKLLTSIAKLNNPK